MILSWGSVYDGAWLHYFRFRGSAARGIVGGYGLLACSFPRSREIYTRAAVSTLSGCAPTFVLPVTSRLQSRASSNTLNEYGSKNFFFLKKKKKKKRNCFAVMVTSNRDDAAYQTAVLASVATLAPKDVDALDVAHRAWWDAFFQQVVRRDRRQDAREGVLRVALLARRASRARASSRRACGATGS